MALGALRRPRQGAIRRGAVRRGRRRGAARGDPCSWFRALAHPAQVAHREVRLAQALRPPATQWSWLAQRMKKAIRRETLPHCLLALAAAPLPLQALVQQRCRATLLSGQAARP